MYEALTQAVGARFRQACRELGKLFAHIAQSLVHLASKRQQQTKRPDYKTHLCSSSKAELEQRCIAYAYNIHAPVEAQIPQCSAAGMQAAQPRPCGTQQQRKLGKLQCSLSDLMQGTHG